jgi:hypothetical protein
MFWILKKDGALVERERDIIFISFLAEACPDYELLLNTMALNCQSDINWQ